MDTPLSSNTTPECSAALASAQLCTLPSHVCCSTPAPQDLNVTVARNANKVPGSQHRQSSCPPRVPPQMPSWPGHTALHGRKLEIQAGWLRYGTTGGEGGVTQPPHTHACPPFACPSCLRTATLCRGEAGSAHPSTLPAAVCRSCGYSCGYRC